MQQAGAALDKILIGSLRRAPLGQAVLLAWPLVCGSKVSERTRALDFSASVLRVEVSDERWKAQLQSFAPRYLAELNRYCGEKVERIDFVIRQT